MTDDYDTAEKVEHTEKGYRLTVESKRGTGTRDQDKVSASLKTESLAEIVEERPAMVTTVVNTMSELRGFQPDETDDEGE